MNKYLKPLVSVIIATYNHEEVLLQAIDSVCIQDYERIQLIVADDGSEDFSLQNVESYIERNKGSNICEYIVYSNESNLGTVRNMNKALRYAKGDIIAELGGDDRFAAENTIREVAAALENNEIIMTSSVHYIGKAKYLWPHYIDRKLIAGRMDSSEKQYASMINGFTFNWLTSGCFYKRAVIERMGYYDENYNYLEDGPFFLNYTWENKIEYRYNLITYIHYDGGISRGFNTNRKYNADIERIMNVECYKHYEDMKPFTQKCMDYYRNKVYCRSAKERLCNGLKYLPVVAAKSIYRIYESIAAMLDQIIFLKERL